MLRERASSSRAARIVAARRRERAGERLPFDVLGAKQVVGRYVRRGLGLLGYELHKTGNDRGYPVDYDRETIELYEEVRPYTLTSHERVNALRHAVTYLVEAGIEGAFLECGVWRGGSMLAVAKTLLALGDTDRDLYFFDTFTTMPEPGDEDVDVLGNRAADLYDDAVTSPVFSYPPMGVVRELVARTGYPRNRMHFVKGLVEDTIPEHAPDLLALCRLDTDLYSSTKHEMVHLFPRVNEGGVMIIDDYGQFMGAKKAVDEYLRAIGGGVLLERIDFTARLVIVTADTRRRAQERAHQHESAR
jgi:hypothetical protein